MKSLSETHGVLFELTRHFLARSLDSELFAKPGQWRPVATGCLAMLLCTRFALIAILSPRASLRESAQLASAETFAAAAPMLFVMCVCGLMAIVQSQMLLPTRRDYLALAGLPVHPRQIFVARFAAFSIFATAVVVALNAAPALISPAPVACGFSWALACYFPMFAMIGLQGLLLNVLPSRWFGRVLPMVQGALGCCLLLGILLSLHITAWARDGQDLLVRFAWTPPVWFVGLEQVLRGRGNLMAPELAARAEIGFAASLVIALAVYLVSYRRYRKLLMESPDMAVARRDSDSRFLNLIARGPQQTAVLQFMLKTMTRSRTHRMVLLAYGGAAAGILINSLLVQESASRWRAGRGYLPNFVVYFWPIVASMLLLPGLRHAFRMPAEWRANWLFRITESDGRMEWMKAVERAIVLFAIVPIYSIDGPVAIAALGWPLGLRVLSLQMLASLMIFEGLFYSWQQLPFACSYAPAERALMTILGKYLGAIFFVAPPLAVLTAVYSQLPATWVIVGGAMLVAWLRLRWMRRQGWGESKLIYEEDADGLLNLGLKS